MSMHAEMTEQQPPHALAFDGSIQILVPAPAMPRTSPISAVYSFTATPASARWAAALQGARWGGGYGWAGG